MPGVNGHELHARLGTWKLAEDVDGKLGGSWAQGKEVHAKVGGSWVKVWEDNLPPGSVTGLGTSVGVWTGSAHPVTATWALPADPDLASVTVTWTVNGVAQTPQVLAAGATSHTYNAPPNATVSAAVKVTDTGGLDGPTVTSSARTVPPGAVTGITATQVALDVVRLSWTPPAGATEVRAYRSLNGGAYVPVSLGLATVWDDRVGVGSSVSYRLAAVSAAGEGPQSSVVSATASAPAPGNFRFTGYTHTSADLAWDAVAHATGYEMEGIGGGPTAATTRSIGGLSWNSDYSWRVRAYSTYGGVTAYGPWTSFRNLNTGNPEWSYTQPWSSGNYVVDRAIKDQVVGPSVPAGVTVHTMRFQLFCNFSTSLLAGTATRTADYVLNGASFAPVGTQPNPWNVDIAPWTVVGPSGPSGIVPRGTGWGVTPGSDFSISGYIILFGDQTVNVPYVAPVTS